MQILALLLPALSAVEGAAAAAEDEVVLKGGGRISGAAEERDGRVIIRTEHGTVTLPRDRVESIDKTKRSTLQDYEERRAKTDFAKPEDVKDLLAFAEAHAMESVARTLREQICQLRWQAVDRSQPAELESFSSWARANGHAAAAERALKGLLELKRSKVSPKDAEALYALALWARSNGLGADALVFFQEAVKANPDHEFARRALGYQSYQGKWMTEREIKIAQGLIEHEGEWVTPAAKEALVVARTLEKERKLLEEARRKLEEERAAAREEYRRQKESLDARLAEVNGRIEELKNLPLTQPPVVVVYCTRSGCGIVGAHTHPPSPFQK